MALCLATFSTAPRAATLTRAQVEAALPKLEALAQHQVDNGGAPGFAIAVVYDGELVYLKGFGVREAGKPEKIDDDTVFQIASLSKPISSTVVAALVSDGVLDWDSKIADLDPGFRLHDPYPTAELTLRDLFNHRSGLPGVAGNELEQIGFDRATILNRLRLVPPGSSFRAGYSYSNFAMTEGGIAAAMAAGKPWEEVADEKLYKPLGMTETSSRHADFLSRPDRAALHVKFGGVWKTLAQRDADAQTVAGGVSSTARDLAKWMELQLASGMFDGKQLISKAALDATHVPLMARGNNPVNGSVSFYGLGWNVEFGRYGTTWGHAGAFSAGASTQATLFPDAKLGIVVLANAFPSGVPDGLIGDFAELAFTGKLDKDWVEPWDAAYNSLFEPPNAAAIAMYGKPPAAATPALPDTAYAGHYANDYIGDAKVIETNGGLSLIVGPKGAMTYPMTHFDRDLFLIRPTPEAPDVPSSVKFSIGPDGKADAVTIDFLNDVGLGTLKRAD
ncbi:MAG: serine hydrolase [Devosia sp.]